MININKKIYIAGHCGMVGMAVWEAFKKRGYFNLIGRTSKELDLRNQQAVSDFFKIEKPDIVINAAAIVGGIMSNSNYPYKFIMDNMLIQNNLIDSSHKAGVENFIFLGSSCIYPKLASQPIKEEYLLTSSLEPTNEWYAIAKISGIKTCEAIKKEFGKNFISLMPSNLYGPYDNFDLVSSHVLPAMIRKFHEAKENNNSVVELWGSGKPMREFLFVDDLADSIIFILEKELKDNIYNIGTGIDLTISNLALLIQKIVGYKGEIIWDLSKPDGTQRKLMDISKIINEGWKAKFELEDGITKTYKWFVDNQKTIKYK